MIEAGVLRIKESEQRLILTPCLVVFSGLPASGKSSLAKEVADRTNAQLLDIDVIRAELFPQIKGGEIDTNGEKQQMFTAYQRMYELARNSLINGDPAILSATFSSLKSHEEVEKLARDLHVPLKVFSLNAPIRVLEERLIARQYQINNHSNVTRPEHLQEIQSRFCKMVGEDVVEVDTSQPQELNLSQVITEMQSFRAVEI